jgi:hypothetical protein
MNGFLSTTYNQKIATKVVEGVGQNRPDYESLVFELHIDVTTITKIYPDISSISQFPLEEEALFTNGSVKRIQSINNPMICIDYYTIITQWY